MGLRVASPPARRPLEPDDVRTQLATYAEHGPQVLALIEAAVERAETYLGRALITQTLVLTLDGFPGQYFGVIASRRWAHGACWRIELPRPPLQQVSEIRYLDESGVQQTLDPSAYRVTTGREPAAIEPAYGATWPSTLPVSEAVEVEYVAGYGDDGASVPRSIRHALTMMVGEWLEFREGLVVGTIAEPIPNSVKFLLDGERVGRLFAFGGEG